MYAKMAAMNAAAEPLFPHKSGFQTLQIYALIRQRGRRRQNHRGIVNNVTAKCVGLERCRLNMSYISLWALIYQKLKHEFQLVRELGAAKKVRILLDKRVCSLEYDFKIDCHLRSL